MLFEILNKADILVCHAFLKKQEISGKIKDFVTEQSRTLAVGYKRPLGFNG